jgi:hypothetical protein
MVNLPVPLSISAKHPSTLFSSKYFLRLSSIVTLLGEHALKKAKSNMQYEKAFILFLNFRKGSCSTTVGKLKGR